MRLFIMTDLEGVAGVINGKDYLYPTGRYYETARRLLTEEVNAAIAGFAAHGFDDFLVADGHGAGAINVDLLDPRARLSRGWIEGTYPFALDRSHDAAAWVGQHAKAGTPYSHLTHTGWFNVLDVQINGVSVGEYGQVALCAGELDVPVIFAAGEKAFCAEAKRLTPWVHTVAVLEGVRPTTGDELTGEAYETCHEAAIHLQPQRACELIRAEAEAAARHFAESRSDFQPLKFDPPFRMLRKLRPYQGEPARSDASEDPDSIIELLRLGKG